MSLFEAVQNKSASSKQAPPPPPKACAEPQPAQSPAHGVAANHLINKSAIRGGGEEAKADLGKVQEAGKSDGGVVKNALGDLFSGFADTAKGIAGAFKEAGSSIKNALFGNKDSAQAMSGGDAFAGAKSKEGVSEAQAHASGVAAPAAAPAKSGVGAGNGLLGKIGSGIANAFGGLAGALGGGIGSLFGGGKGTENKAEQFDDAKTYDPAKAPDKMQVLDPNAPAQGATKAEKDTQQYSQSGLPLTAEAWKMQNTIDGGKLYDVYKALEKQVADGKIPKEQLEQKAIDNYIKMANETKGANFILEVMPTEMQWSTGGANDKQGGNTGIGDYRVGGDVAQTRRIAESVSDTLAAKAGQDPNSNDPEQIRKAKAQVFALMVPYNNGAENIAAHDAKPMDAVENLHNLLGRIDNKNVNTIATGYSQGGGAVLEYAHKYGGQDGLDKVIAMAPMGGADRFGADGVYSGNMKGQDNRPWYEKINPFAKKPEDPGVDVLSIMNASDPAKHIYDPLKDNPVGRDVRNGLVDSVPSMIGGGLNALGSMIPGAGLLGGLWNGAKNLLGNEKTQDQLAQWGGQKISNGAQPGINAALNMPPGPERDAALEAAQNNQQMGQALPAMVNLLQRDGTKAGDIAALLPSMINFMGGGNLNNAVKDGLGWAGAKASDAAPWVGGLAGMVNPLLGAGVNAGLSGLGSWATGQSNSMHTENMRPDGTVADVHGAPKDGRYDLGTYGYGMNTALPLLDTFLGGPSVTNPNMAGPDAAKVQALQAQIAANQGKDYSRAGDWEFIRQEDDPNNPQQAPQVTPVH